MLDVAESTRPGLYDSLVAADVVAFLRRHLPTAQSGGGGGEVSGGGRAGAFDLVVAADVLVYMRALDHLFEAAAACLVRGGPALASYLWQG
jgi:predicted TPR repeat methyltransferase